MSARESGLRKRGAAATTCVGWLALALQGLACNAFLGLNDVNLVAADGGSDRGGGATGTGGSGAGGASGAAGTAGSSCARELSQNGAFDLGRTSWNIGASEPAELIFVNDAPELTAHGITPYSGEWALRLGGIRVMRAKYLTHYVEQHVSIPPNATEIAITGRLQVRTLETSTGDDFDLAGVLLFDDGAPPPAVPFFRSAPVPTWSNRTTATSWTSFRFTVDVRQKAGLPLMLRIFADLDPDPIDPPFFPTFFFFDSVSVAVTACQ